MSVSAPAHIVSSMRLLVARCSVRYTGRLSAELPDGIRLLMIKADGSVLIHADSGGYKPLNWMTPPTVIEEQPGRIAAARASGSCAASGRLTSGRWT